MRLIITPGQLSRHSELYYQLAQFTSAGIGIVAALQQLERSPPSRAFRRPIREVLSALGAGLTLAESIGQVPDWLPEFDYALVSAGEQSGQLDNSFRMLASYYQERARLLREMLSNLAYPLLLLHAAVFILPFADFFISGDGITDPKRTLGILVPFYFVIGLFVWLSQGRHGESWRAAWERLANLVPVLGTGRRSLALGRLSAALQALLGAGVNIVTAWKLAADASGSPALKRHVHSWGPSIEAGETPSDLVSQTRLFPEMFASQYATGEISGRLEDHLGRLRNYYEEDGRRRLQAVTQWVPRLFYFVIVLLIAYRIVSFWSGYFNKIQNIGNF